MRPSTIDSRDLGILFKLSNVQPDCRRCKGRPESILTASELKVSGAVAIVARWDPV